MKTIKDEEFKQYQFMHIDRDGYYIYRVFKNNKGHWAAMKRGVNNDYPFEISYAQGRGAEQINPTPIKKLSVKLGQMLLPR